MLNIQQLSRVADHAERQTSRFLLVKEIYENLVIATEYMSLVFVNEATSRKEQDPWESISQPPSKHLENMDKHGPSTMTSIPAAKPQPYDRVIGAATSVGLCRTSLFSCHSYHFTILSSCYPSIQSPPSRAPPSPALLTLSDLGNGRLCSPLGAREYGFGRNGRSSTQHQHILSWSRRQSSLILDQSPRKRLHYPQDQG